LTPKTPEDELRRAGDAKEILENEFFKEACKQIEDGLKAQRNAVPVRDTDMHTRLILTEQLWDSLKKYLEITAQTGKFAEFEIKKRESFLKRFVA
jgi:hypothetical protein